MQATISGLRGRTQYKVSVEAVNHAGLVSPMSLLSTPGSHRSLKNHLHLAMHPLLKRQQLAFDPMESTRG